MGKRLLLTSLLLVLCFLAGRTAQEAHAVNATQLTNSGSSSSSGHIILEQGGVVSVRTWLGSAACDRGYFYQVEPVTDLLYEYSAQSKTAVLGHYSAGDELVFAIRPQTSMCLGTHWFSTDQMHARVNKNADGSWTIIWEDLVDKDYNDLYTEITVTPDVVYDRVIPETAFDLNPTYKLPWPTGQIHTLTVSAGEEEHMKRNHSGVVIGSRAYDFSMNPGDKITAAAGGIVLWVEDSFGSGSCDPILDKRNNLIVIWTEIGANTLYEHIRAGSARVRVGDVVHQGQVIASAGNSGFVCRSREGTGTHLHFEWQHHCYDLEQAVIKRGQNGSRPGQPTLSWYCTPFPPNAPYFFTIGGAVQNLGRGRYTSDNAVPTVETQKPWQFFAAAFLFIKLINWVLEIETRE